MVKFKLMKFNGKPLQKKQQVVSGAISFQSQAFSIRSSNLKNGLKQKV